MQDQNTQQDMGDPKASLAFSNMLRENMLRADHAPIPTEEQSMDTPQEPQDDQGTMENEDADITLEPEENPEMEDLKSRVEKLENPEEGEPKEDNGLEEIKTAVEDLGKSFEKKRKEDKESIIKEIHKIIND